MSSNSAMTNVPIPIWLLWSLNLGWLFLVIASCFTNNEYSGIKSATSNTIINNTTNLDNMPYPRGLLWLIPRILGYYVYVIILSFTYFYGIKQVIVRAEPIWSKTARIVEDKQDNEELKGTKTSSIASRRCSRTSEYSHVIINNTIKELLRELFTDELGELE